MTIESAKPEVVLLEEREVEKMSWGERAEIEFRSREAWGFIKGAQEVLKTVNDLSFFLPPEKLVEKLKELDKVFSLELVQGKKLTKISAFILDWKIQELHSLRSASQYEKPL